MDDGTTLLLDLPGVSVLRVEAEGGGGRVVHVETADDSAAACPECGVFSTSVKQHRTTAPRDIPYGQNGIRLVWHKRRMRCREPLCGRTSFTEAIEQVPAYARVTGRCRAAMARCVGDDNHSVAEVAAGHGVSWPTTHRAVVAYGDAVLGEPDPVAVLGIDETRRGRPRWTQDPDTCRWTRLDRWHSGFVDISGSQGLLGQTLGRRAVDVTDWLPGAARRFGMGSRTWRSTRPPGTPPRSAWRRRTR